MRDPLRTIREMGLGAFLSMQVVLGGGLLAAMAHLPLLGALAFAIVAPGFAISAADWTLVISGYATATLAALFAASVQRDRRLARRRAHDAPVLAAVVSRRPAGDIRPFLSHPLLGQDRPRTHATEHAAPMDLTATIAVLAAAAGLFAFGSWRSAQPADPLKPRLIPWRLVIILSGAVGVLMLAHVANLFGIQTGSRTGMR